MQEQVKLSVTVPDEFAGLRLDQACAKSFTDFSRAKLTQWIKSGELKVNSDIWLPKQKVQGGEIIQIDAEHQSLIDEAEDIPLNIVYEDEHILLLNKSANCVVHPGAGNWQGTLLNALLHHNPQQKLLPRAGIIHRLDKDTTGLMVVAKSQLAYTQLVADLSARQIARHYYALVKGEILSGGTINHPIGRHPHNRLKMAVIQSGKPAVSHYRVAKRFTGYTLLKVQLETGRTHQIRVHLSHQHYPLVGDQRYAGRARLASNLSPRAREAIINFNRPALHAYHLAFKHPASSEWLSWDCSIPTDMTALLKELEDHEIYQSGLASTELG